MTVARRSARLVLVLTVVVMLASGCSLRRWTGLTHQVLPGTRVTTTGPSPAALAPADAEEAQLIALYQRVSPAVVSVQVVRPVEGLFLPQAEGQEDD